LKALIDLHTHTVSSGHAYSTLKENIEEAALKGLMILGTSDHAMSMPGSPNQFFFENYKVIRDHLMGVRILRGIEANIIGLDGKIDVDEKIISNLDYVIASFHSHCVESGTVEENTSAIIRAMQNPYINIIGHPDDERYKIDYHSVVENAKKYRVALELNNSSLLSNTARKNCRNNAMEMLHYAKKIEADIIMGSDSHIFYDVGRFDEAIALLKEIDFPEKLVINFDCDRLNKILSANRLTRIL
jgi:putative hydrolase